MPKLIKILFSTNYKFFKKEEFLMGRNSILTNYEPNMSTRRSCVGMESNHRLLPASSPQF
jgi:hypothetical protein